MMPFAELSDPVKLAIVTGVFVMLGSVGTFFKDQLDKRRAERIALAVKATLATATDKQNEKLGEIHALVNSGMGAQLETTAIALRRLATLSAEPDDVIAADRAEELFREHQKKQANADSNKPR